MQSALSVLALLYCEPEWLWIEIRIHRTCPFHLYRWLFKLRAYFCGANVLWIDGLISSCQSLPTREAFLQLYIVASVVTWKSHFLFCALAHIACEHSCPSSLPARVAFGEKFRPSLKTPLGQERQRTAVFAGYRSYERIIAHVASLSTPFGAQRIEQLYKTALNMILHFLFHFILF